MTATAHALLGTVIAAKFGNPYLAVPLALGSHIVADLIPHWDTAFGSPQKDKKRIFWETVGDVLLGFTLSYSVITFIFPDTNLFYAFAIVIAAQLPDWMFAPYYFFGWKNFKWAYEMGKNTNINLDKPWGIFTQIATVALVILLGKIF